MRRELESRDPSGPVVGCIRVQRSTRYVKPFALASEVIRQRVDPQWLVEWKEPLSPQSCMQVTAGDVASRASLMWNRHLSRLNGSQTGLGCDEAVSTA